MREERETPLLQLAIRKRNLDTARVLIEQKGMSLDETDADGNTALHEAALYNHVDITKLLITKGCNVLLQNRLCELPIDLTDNSEVQELMCSSMESCGHEQLARQYRDYLGLHQARSRGSDKSHQACPACTPEVINYQASNKSLYSQAVRQKHHQGNLHVSSLVIQVKPSFEVKSDTRQQVDFHCQQLVNATNQSAMDSDNDSSYSSDNEQARNLYTISSTDNGDSTEPGAASLHSVEEALYNLTIAIASGVGVSSTGSNQSSFGYRPQQPIVRRPRRSSLATVESRKLSEGRRKSVSFQPEVLLQQIVTEGDVEEIKDILSSSRMDINRMSPAGLTALHQAAVDGNLECAQTLLLNGGDVNVTDCEGCTPLHTATLCGHVDFVHFLLAAGADPFLKTDDGQIAIEQADDPKIKKMLRSAMNGKVFDFQCSYSSSSSPSAAAAAAGSSDVESDVSETEEGGGYFEDDEYSEEEEIRTVVPEQEEVMKNDDNGASSPSSVFTEGPATNLFGTTFPSLRSRQPISSCSSCESNDVGGAVAEESAANRRTHPRANSETQPPTIVLPPEEKEMDVEADNHLYASEDQGISTMDGSSDGGAWRGQCSEETSLSIDPDLTLGSKDYSFQEAVLSCNVEALLKLQKYCSEIVVDRINQSGITALHHAVLEENYNLVQHLVKDFNADVQIRDTDGWSPLHAASAVGDIRTAQFLLENGAKASQLNNNCEFPVDLAPDRAMEQLLKAAMLGPTIGKLFTGILTKNS